MQVVKGVYALSATLEIEEEDIELTVHPAAVETERGIVLLDAGWPGAIDQLEGRLGEAGFGWEDVWAALLTHQDVDHAGGLSDVVDRADPVVFAHRDCAPYVDGREHPVKMDEGERYPPVRVDVELADGARFATAAGPLEVLFTPGHAPGHVSLYFEDEHLLVSGDALHAPEGELDGPRGPLDEAAAVDSIDRLSNLDVERTLTYHGGLVEHEPDAIGAIRTEGGD